MPNQPKHPLIFICDNCGNESTYPNYLKEDEAREPITSVIKKCTTCGADNTIKIPKGWKAERNDEVLRGLKEE